MREHGPDFETLSQMEEDFEGEPRELSFNSAITQEGQVLGQFRGRVGRLGKAFVLVSMLVSEACGAAAGAYKQEEQAIKPEELVGEPEGKKREAGAAGELKEESIDDRFESVDSRKDLLKQMKKAGVNVKDYFMIRISIGWIAKKKIEAGGIDETQDKYIATSGDVRSLIMLDGGDPKDYFIARGFMGTVAKKKVEAGGKDESQDEYTARSEKALQDMIRLAGGNPKRYRITKNQQLGFWFAKRIKK